MEGVRRPRQGHEANACDWRVSILRNKAKIRPVLKAWRQPGPKMPDHGRKNIVGMASGFPEHFFSMMANKLQVRTGDGARSDHLLCFRQRDEFLVIARNEAELAL